MRVNDAKAKNEGEVLMMNNERQFASVQLIGKRNEVEIEKGKKEIMAFRDLMLLIQLQSNLLLFQLNRGKLANSRQFSVFSKLFYGTLCI